ncbi:MAG: MoaD/ThiS family protein [Desulfobacterales bacterium]
MSVKVSIHKTHRNFTGGLETVDVKGKTIGDCLKDLIERYPGMGKVLFKPDGKLHPLIEIYLNMKSAYPDELKKQVKAGDEIYITLMLAGG